MMWSQEDIDKAKENFWAFVYIVWKSIGLPKPTPIQIDIAQFLQNPPSDRVIIQGFRGVAKSFLTCAYAVWRLWSDRDLKVLIISASSDRADANARFIKSIINTLPFLEDMKASKGQLDTQNLFSVGGAKADISPSVKSVGITGQITGTRADLLISDDVEVPKNSGTQMQRDKLSEAVKEYDAILKPNGQIIYLGTPQNEASLYNALQQRGYITRIWPVEYPHSKAERDSYGDSLAPFIADRYDKDPEKWAGKPTDPERFDELEIAKRKLSYGRAGFALQFMLNTNLSDYEKYPLKVSDLIVDSLDHHESSIKWSWANGSGQRLTDIPCVAMKGDLYYGPLSRSEETAPYTGTVMAVDPSGRGSDESAYAIMKYLNGYLFLMEVGGFQEGYSDLTLTLMAQKAKYWNVNEVVVEANFGDGMFTKVMTPIFNKIHPVTITEVKNTKQKELRIIDTLEPVMMRHRLIINRAVVEDDYRRYEDNQAYSLIYQMTRLCRDRNALSHDDRLDALTMAVAYWLDVMDASGSESVVEEWDIEDVLQYGVFGRSNPKNHCLKNIRDLQS
ncbi:MAG: phage terminase large subunit [Acidaminococcus intestini]|uniref:Phage terminase large subunit n=1 Tax=Acidaminococcus intestini TaxID=187327 RepID=A0A943EKP5_9FIRM|nr:phage terminase large subunit [Acidaminococcus intestini]